MNYYITKLNELENKPEYDLDHNRFIFSTLFLPGSKEKMKKLAAAILLISFMCGTFSRTAIVVDYYTNTASFAKNCINKSRPMLHCNGKCQMMMKLRQEEKKDNTNPERKNDNKFEVLSSKSFFIAHLYCDMATQTIIARTLLEMPVDRSYSLLKPPLV